MTSNRARGRRPLLLPSPRRRAAAPVATAPSAAPASDAAKTLWKNPASSPDPEPEDGQDDYVERLDIETDAAYDFEREAIVFASVNQVACALALLQTKAEAAGAAVPSFERRAAARRTALLGAWKAAPPQQQQNATATASLDELAPSERFIALHGGGMGVYRQVWANATLLPFPEGRVRVPCIPPESSKKPERQSRALIPDEPCADGTHPCAADPAGDAGSDGHGGGAEAGRDGAGPPGRPRRASRHHR